MTTIIGVLMIVPFMLAIAAGLVKDDLKTINEVN